MGHLSKKEAIRSPPTFPGRFPRNMAKDETDKNSWEFEGPGREFQLCEVLCAGQHLAAAGMYRLPVAAHV